MAVAGAALFLPRFATYDGREGVRQREREEAERAEMSRVSESEFLTYAVVRKREIENLEQMSGEELRIFLDTLPAGRDTISRLLDFVEDELYDTDCNHSLQYAMRFMMENRLDFGKITSWLNENGGYCDCKVLEQIAPAWRAKFGDD